jgi:hypothetical protein
MKAIAMTSIRGLGNKYQGFDKMPEIDCAANTIMDQPSRQYQRLKPSGGIRSKGAAALCVHVDRPSGV